MRVRGRNVDWKQRPPQVAEYAVPGQVFVTVGEDYEVHAAAVYRGILMLQIVNDLDYPSWLPVWLFDADDPSIPPDWISSVFHEEPSLVLGPAFVAKDLESYDSMVELETDQMARFWARVDRGSAIDEENA